MGNAGSNPPRERMKTGSGEIAPPSPSKDGQAFVFDKKPEPRLSYQGSHEEDAPYFAKPDAEFVDGPRPRSNTLTEGTKNDDHTKVFEFFDNFYHLFKLAKI